MTAIQISIHETKGKPRFDEFVQVGLPFAKGELSTTANLVLRDEKGERLSFQAHTRARWPDGSIRFLGLYFVVSADANSQQQLQLSVEQSQDGSVENAIEQEVKDGDEKADSATGLELDIQESAEQLIVNTGLAKFSLSTDKLAPNIELCLAEALDANCTDDDKDSTAGADSVAASVELSQSSEGAKQLATTKVERSQWLERGPLTALLRQQGKFLINGQYAARFDSQMRFVAGDSLVVWDLSLHNPRAALHRDGIWDLGDPGSFLFNSLGVKLELKQNEKAELNQSLYLNSQGSALYGLAGDENAEQTDAADTQSVVRGHARLFQASSGGQNWLSDNHKNARGKIPCPFRGFQVTQNSQITSQGNRTQAQACLGSSRSQLVVGLENFWQNFPKALQLNDDHIQLELFPEGYDQHYELQGGESKTHRIFLSFSGIKPGDHAQASPLEIDKVNLASSPLICQLPADYWQQSGALPYAFAAEPEPKLKALVDNAILGEGRIELKNERLDEFGWRNFGDIYADHEALGYEGESTFVSHYNNQYDLLMGMTRQFLLYKDQRWLDLLQPFARHIYDIDIYKTQRDKAEYNGGLFWHTDHYLDAETCTHRTYSKAHKAVNEHACGGGPGGEHCYASGLLFHYYLSGSVQSAEGVLSLSRWIKGFYEGDGGWLDGLLKFKSVGIPRFKAKLKGQKVVKFNYPLDRGVGNYIKALLDSFQLTTDEYYLKKAARVIRATVHPAEDISLRNLDDVERCWFYTIFLQAVAAFLKEKEALEQYDEDYVYARDAFLHFARWMAANEQPYLDRPEILDYPNHAWVAQEIRRANLLFIASLYETEDKALFKQRGEFFYQYCVNEMDKTETKVFTRMYAVLLQNYGVRDYCLNHPGLKLKGPKAQWRSQQLYYSWPSLLAAYTVGLGKRFLGLSLKREIRWLSSRSEKLAKLLGQEVHKL